MEPMSVIASAADRKRESWEDAARGDVSWFTLFSGDITPTTAMSAGVAEFPPHGGTSRHTAISTRKSTLSRKEQAF